MKVEGYVCREKLRNQMTSNKQVRVTVSFSKEEQDINLIANLTNDLKT